MPLTVDGRSRFSGLGMAPGFSRNAYVLGLHGSRKYPNFIQQEACFWTRSLWEKIGGQIPDTYRFAADFHLWSLFFQYAPLLGIDCPLAAFRYHPSQRSNASCYLEEVEEILTALRQCSDIPPHNHVVPVLFMDAKKKQADILGPPLGDWSLSILPDDKSVVKPINLHAACKELRSQVASLKKQATLRYQIKNIFKKLR